MSPTDDRYATTGRDRVFDAICLLAEEQSTPPRPRSEILNARYAEAIRIVSQSMGISIDEITANLQDWDTS
jgi:hypothetical protein